MSSRDPEPRLVPETVTDRVLSSLRRIIRAVDGHSRDVVTRCGLTGPQVVVLKNLAAAGSPVAIGELSDAVLLSQATVTGILDRLVKRGLVTRTRSDSDRRRVLVSLTAAGEEAARSAPPLLQDSFTSRFCALEEWEQTQILAVLQHIAAMLEARDLEATPILTSGPMTAGPEETRAFLSSPVIEHPKHEASPVEGVRASAPAKEL